MDQLPKRKQLSHVAPAWVETGAVFFITINTASRGENILAQKNIADALIESAKRYHTMGQWWVELFLVMPDHLHALMSVPADRHLNRTITAWKSYQTKNLGIDWQSGFFDHRLRSDESAVQKADYIRMNPVRAGLVSRPEEWAYTWSPIRQGDASG